MVTDSQVKLLRRKLMQGKTLVAAAAAAGMCERSARRWKEGLVPSEAKKPRHWRTRADAFAEVWEDELVPLLEKDAERVLEARTLLGQLEKRHPGINRTFYCAVTTITTRYVNSHSIFLIRSTSGSEKLRRHS